MGFLQPKLQTGLPSYVPPLLYQPDHPQTLLEVPYVLQQNDRNVDQNCLAMKLALIISRSNYAEHTRKSDCNNLVYSHIQILQNPSSILQCSKSLFNHNSDRIQGLIKPSFILKPGIIDIRLETV